MNRSQGGSKTREDALWRKIGWVKQHCRRSVASPDALVAGFILIQQACLTRFVEPFVC
jgi:hypothetical protein